MNVSARFSNPASTFLPWAMICLSACTGANMVTPSGITPSATPSGVFLPSSGPQAGILLSRLQQDTSSGTPMQINIIAPQGDKTIGNQCKAAEFVPPAPGSGTSNSPCTCTLYYTLPSGSKTQVDVPITYMEPGLVRCSYASLPTATASFDVSIHFTLADIQSNKLTFNLSKAGVTFDSTNINNFTTPTRFQCRDVVNIPYMLDGSVYDPIQSEEPHMTFPLNFYSTNLGQTLQALVDAFKANQGLANWNCPPNLSASQYLSGDPADPNSPISKYNTSNQINLTLYSKAPLNGSYLIYPPPASGSGIDRSSFVLARKPGGAFTVAVNAQVLPLTTSSNAAVSEFTKDPIGWGASAIPNGTGTARESCPDTSVPIPSGHHWMKLWLFRSSLPQRNQKVSNALVRKVTNIFCNPGDWVSDTTVNPPKMAPVMNGCYMTYCNVANSGSRTAQGCPAGRTGTENGLFDVGGGLAADQGASATPAGTGAAITNPKYFYSLSLDDVGKSINGVNVFLADRAISPPTPSTAAMCVRLQSPTATPAKPLCSGSYPGPGCSVYDQWSVHLPYNRDATMTAGPYFSFNTIGCGPYDPSAPQASDIRSDPFGICPKAPTSAQGESTATAGTPVITDPNDVITQAIDKGGSRFDFVYVVSPPSIMLADMQNSSASSPGAPYQPVRFKLASDCTSNNPNSCNSDNILGYDMKLHDVGTNGNPPADDPSRPGIFPICVLQKD